VPGKGKSRDSAVTVSNRQRRLRLDRARLRRLVRFVAQAQGRALESVDLAVVSAEEMRALNSRYLGRDEVTDVLSFDLSEPSPRRSAGKAPAVSAQIVVCADEAMDQARRRGHLPQRELMLYVVHGLLHLTGHSDATAAAARRMHAREDELLTAFGEAPTFAPERRRRR